MRFSQETIALSESEFVILRDLIRERTGLFYDHGKREMLADKLSGRVLECGFNTFIDYYYLLKYGPQEEAEWVNVIDALSVQETYFWREMDQIRALVDVVVPRHFASPTAEPLKIWSAACATGEEPLTIAMALKEAGWLGRAPIRIQASDASRAALERARAGIYRERSFRSIPLPLRKKYFVEMAGGWQIDSELHAQVNWSSANVTAAADIARLPLAHVVFCRNVFIYFAPPTITKAVRLFADRMPRSGYLFIGVSESLLGLPTDFELQEVGGAFVYVKK